MFIKNLNAKYTYRKQIFLSKLVVIVVFSCVSGHAHAVGDPVFQNFFRSVCGGGVSGALQTRCVVESAGGELSGDSEVSLNPNQVTSGNNRSLAQARNKSRNLHERFENLRRENVSTIGAPGGSAGDFLGESFNMFIKGAGAWFDRDGKNERSFDGITGGVNLGFDYRLSKTTIVGSLIGYENTDADFDADNPGRNFAPQSDAGGIDEDSYSIAIFASHTLFDRLFIDGSVGYTFSDYDFSRNVIFQESNRVVPQTNVRASGDTQGHQYWLSGAMGYEMNFGALTVSPYSRVTFARSEIDGYRENDNSGSGLQMNISKNTRESLITVLGVRSNYAINTQYGVLLPYLKAEYEHEFEKSAQSTRTSFVLDGTGNQFTVRGDNPDRDYANLGAGITAILPNGWLPFLDFEALIGHRFLDRYRLTGGIRIRF